MKNLTDRPDQTDRTHNFLSLALASVLFAQSAPAAQARWEDVVRKNLNAEARQSENNFKKLRAEWRSLVRSNGAGLERQLAGTVS